jgi:beta-galactosidase
MYEPGILKAIGLEAGMEKENILIVSAGDAAGIELKADRSSLAASGNDLSYIQVALRDNDGNLVQHNDLQLNLSVSGPGAIAAAGNAAPDDMESFRSLTPKTYRGRALIIVRPSGEPGTIVIKVSARGLPAESISINTGKSG